MKQLRWVSLFCSATLLACTIARPVDVAPEPASVAAFLAAHHPADLQVIDSAGHARWLHNPRLNGDTLRGLRDRGPLPPSVSIPLSQVRAFAIPKFSGARTLSLAGGFLAVSAVALIVLVPDGPRPVYSAQPTF